MRKKFVIILTVFLIASMGFIIAKEEISTDVKDELIACTMDVKMCPDGSYVGRIAPDCEFAPCPEENKEKISANEIIEKDLNNKISHLSSDLGKIEANIDLNKKLRDGVHAGECPTCFNEISNEYVDNIHNKFNETINSFMLEKENKEITDK